MASYKVSYKVLRQQGEDIKTAAKLVDGYAERVGQIRGKLGSDGLLAEVRGNLQKLQAQLGESRAVLNAAGDFLVKIVESYSGTETRQVKKVDGTKAHNRDFYKNPVVVASAGGAAGGAAIMGAAGAVPSPAASTTTVNYTDNSVNVTYAAPESAAGAPAPDVQPASPQTAAASGTNASPEASAAQAAQPAGANAVGITAAGVLGGAATAGAVAGGLHLKKRRGTRKESAAAESSGDGYDPEAELEKAIARVRELVEEDCE